MWAAWQLSSEELASLAADTLIGLGMLVEEGGAQELERLRNDLDGAGLSLWEEQQANSRLRLALESARRGRRDLRARVAELEAERHTTNEALDDAVRELRARGADAGAFVPRTERSYWVDIAAALNAAHAVGMPVGIDLDGTLTDRNSWSVVWDRAAEEWTVAGYEDDLAGSDAAEQQAQAVREDEDVTPQVQKLRALLAGQREAQGEHYASVHHTYRVGRDLPETGGA